MALVISKTAFGKAGRINAWFAFAVLLFIPAALISQAFSLFLGEYRQQTLNQKTSNARIEMAKLQSELSEQNVVQIAMNEFTSRIGKTPAETLGPDFAGEAGRIFRRRFPKKSLLTWFNQDFHIVTPTGEPEIEQKRAWQAFARSVFAPRSTDNMNRRIADGFVKSVMSDFRDTTFFAELLNKCTAISFKGQKHYIAFFHLQGQKSDRTTGYLIAIIPSEKAKPFWLQERALRRIADKGMLIGGYFISSDMVVNNSTISENQLHGFLSDFRAGRPRSIRQGIFYFSETCFINPDLFITIGIPLSRKDLLFESFLDFIPYLLWLPGLLCLLISMLPGITDLAGLSLKTRFSLTTLIIAVVPLLLALLYGAINTARLGIEEQQNELQHLKQIFTKIEDEVAKNISDFEANLKTGFLNRFRDRLPDEQTARKMFAELQEFGCEVVTILTPDGRIFHASDTALEKIRQRVCYQISFIRNSLEADGFDIAAIEKTFPKPTAGFSVDDVRYFSSNLRQDFHNRIIRMELGSRLFSSFSTYIKDGNGKLLGCMMLGIDYRRLRQNFLDQVVSSAQTKDSRFFTYSKFNSGKQNMPAVSDMRNLLILTDLTGDSFDFDYYWKKNRYQVFCRSLKDLDSAAIIIRKLENSKLPTGFEQIALLLFIITASLLIACRILKYFDIFFLNPVLKLAIAAERVENGNFSYSAENIGHNELGALQENFGFMVKGLQEKAEMKKYLRQELVTNPGHQHGGSSRVPVTIMFAGVRNFSSLESRLSPEDAMQVMNAFLSICEKSVHAHGGEIDKFMGETAMASFSHSETGSTAQHRAITAALKIIGESGLKPTTADLTIGIGIATGTVIAGKMGSRRKRLDFTFIGDTVNLAARLEKLAGSGSMPAILATAENAENLKKDFMISALEPVKVKGKEQPVEIISVQGLAKE